MRWKSTRMTFWAQASHGFVEMVSGPADSRKAIRTRRVFQGRRSSGSRRSACRAARAPPSKKLILCLIHPSVLTDSGVSRHLGHAWSYLGLCFKSLQCTADLFGCIDRPESKLRSSSGSKCDPTAASPLDGRGFDYKIAMRPWSSVRPVTLAQQLVLIAASLWCVCLACGGEGQWNNCETPWFTARNNWMNGKQK